MIKRQYILILLLVPSINIIASNILHYIEYALVPNTSTNWCIQFMFAMVYLIFDILHLSFSFVLPLILCKCKKEFSVQSGLIVTTAVLAANIIMVVSKVIQADLNYFPHYLDLPVGISMLGVILTSLILIIKKPYSCEDYKVDD